MQYSNLRLLASATASGVIFSISTTGCTPVQSVFSRTYNDATLTLNVESLSSPGQYAVSGEASLPEKTEIAVLAIRNLYSASTRTESTTEPTYSILAYTTVPVVNGTWETTLNLWQIAPDGSYQENWQPEATKLGVTLKPDDTVIVLATLNPIATFGLLEQQLAQQNQRLPRQAIRSNAEGDRYAQIYKQISVGLPTEKTLPPVAVVDDNLGWGNRYVIPEEPPNPTQLERPVERLTNAPTRIDEILR